MPIRVLFYAVPDTNPLAPPTCFVPRWWDYKDGYLRSGVGTDNKWRVYTGTIPVIPTKPYEGRKEWWTHGMSYATYLAGGYDNSGPCVTIPPLSLTPGLKSQGTLLATVSHKWDASPTLLGKGEANTDSVPLSVGLCESQGYVERVVSNVWRSEPVLFGAGEFGEGSDVGIVSAFSTGQMREGTEESIVVASGVGSMET